MFVKDKCYILFTVHSRFMQGKSNLSYDSNISIHKYSHVNSHIFVSLLLCMEFYFNLLF